MHAIVDGDHRLLPTGTQQQPNSRWPCMRLVHASAAGGFQAYQSVPEVLSLVIDTRAPEVAPMS